MTWVDQMLAGIKAGKSRMDIAAELDIPVGVVSKYANVLRSTHEYREAGITDQEFASWKEASLIGLRTPDGELVITRTEPDVKQVDLTLQLIQHGFEPEFKPVIAKAEPKVRKYHCSYCNYYTWYSSRCPRHAFEMGLETAVGCGMFRERD